MRHAAAVVQAAAAMACAGAAVACGAGERARTMRSDSVLTGPGAVEPDMRLRLEAPGDSAARALADSLSREGWLASVAVAGPTRGGWAVEVAVPGGTGLARAFANALRAKGFAPSTIVAGTRPASGLAVSAVPVNGGTHGMSARVRWAASDDRRALLVVEDPRAVENDPLPNGFVLAGEGGAIVQRDSVWDVVPAPDWGRLAYARAYTTAPGEADSVPPSEWHRIAGRVGLLESLVRRNAFPTSGMSIAFGVARPFVIDSLAIAADSTRERALPIAEGWRLAWNADGSRLAIGAPPETISDDAMSSSWRLVDPVTGAPRGTVSAAQIRRPQWTEGPTLDVSTPIDMTERRAFRTAGGDVESEDGWIRVFPRGATRLRTPRVVGPGVALTTTANGSFIVAIAPDPDARPYDPPNRLVVYHVNVR